MEVKQYHPHIHAAASWFRKLENVSTLRSEWLMLLFNCSPCCPSNYLTTIASTFRAKVRSITNSKACCNWPTQFTKEPPLLPGSPQSTPDYYIHRSFISCSFERVASLYKLLCIVYLLSAALCFRKWVGFEPQSDLPLFFLIPLFLLSTKLMHNASCVSYISSLWIIYHNYPHNIVRLIK